MKNYLIISDDYITINSYIEQILKDNKLTKENIIKYDFNDVNLDIIIQDLNTYGFLINNKVIIYENCKFLGSSKIKKDDESDEIEEKSKIDLTSLEKYITNPNLDNILILINDKQDNKKKINKLINDKFIILNDKISIQDKIKENLEDYKMNNITINYLVSICSNDNERILNELEKLKMYKLEEKEITSSDIDKIVMKNLDDDIFSLINAIVKKDKNLCFTLYEEMIEKGETLVKMLVLVADQFRLIYNVKVLSSDGKNVDDIASMLSIHPYRVKLAKEASYSFTYDNLLGYLDKLGDIDRRLKEKNSNKGLEFENFLLNL